MRCETPACTRETTHPSGYCKPCRVWFEWLRRRNRDEDIVEEDAQHRADIDGGVWRDS